MMKAYVKSILTLAAAALLGTTAQASLYVQPSDDNRTANVTVAVGETATLTLQNTSTKSKYTPYYEAASSDITDYCELSVPAEIAAATSSSSYGSATMTIKGVKVTPSTQKITMWKSSNKGDTSITININVTGGGGGESGDAQTFDFGGCTVTVTNATVDTSGDEPLITFSKDGSLSLTKDVRADVLLVGGGGAGGWGGKSGSSSRNGYGGDGGRVTEELAHELSANLFTISVGAGGKASSSSGTAGNSGSRSVLKQGANEILFADGGQGGAALKSDNSAGNGASGSVSAGKQSVITGKTYGAGGAEAPSRSSTEPTGAGGANTGNGGQGSRGDTYAGCAGGSGIVVVRLKEVVIPRTVISVPTATTSFVYDGSKKTCVAAGEHYTRGGVYEATDAGDYTATVTPESGYCWPDQTYGAKTFNWSIARAQIAKPTAATGLVYDGTTQTGVAAGDHYTLGGTYAAKDAGGYSATATLAKNYCWTDKTTAAITLDWSIAKRQVTVSIVATNKVVGEEEPVYPTTAVGFVDGDDVEVSWKVWRTNLVEQLDGSLGLDERVGTYDLVIAGSPAQTKNYTITYENGVGAFEIVSKPIEIDAPTAVQGLTYDGTVQTGVVAGVGYVLTGEAARNAGNHSATATPLAGYCWTGGSTEAKTVSWFMAQLPITVTPDAGQKKTVGKASTITFTTNVTMVGSDRFTGALAVDEDVVGTRAIVLGTLAIDDGNEGANYALTFDDSVTIEVVADGPSIPQNEGTIDYNPTTKEVVVTPEEGVKDVEIINMPSDATAKVPETVDTVKGVEPEKIRVVYTPEAAESPTYDITDAFDLSGDKTGGVTITLKDDPTATVDVPVGETTETIKVTPELTEAGDEVVEPMEVKEGEVDLGAKTIPGLTYSLKRKTELGGEPEVVDSKRADTTRTKLTDPMTGGRPPQAFYVIEVTK